MNWKIYAVSLSVLGMSLGCAFGQDGKIESDRFRESLSPQGNVSDWAGVFTPEQKADLENRIVAVRQSSGAQLAVVAVKSLQGGEIDDFASKLFAQWGIGEKGKDNGVLLLAAIEDRKLRIEVGYGMEGVLNDAKTGRIQDEYIIPRFKDGNFGQGLIDGAEVLLKVMGGDALPDAAAAPEEGGALAGILFTIIFVVVFALIVRAAIRGGKGGSSGWTSGGGSSHGGGFSSGGGGGGGFGGFGGGSSGGGGSSRSW